ncbi:DinB family protein [Mesorhizobium xinjiangense]|uniref:DinB family protein n=1 Tax=Mesorhizobium xinjiangense TaxID=2678685 RepID=UPI0012ECE9B1|nr:DinB family protein [Mesorhizobium xinjiangense]
MDSHQHFSMLAAYNAWANTRIYDAAGELTDAEFARDVGAFFGSLRGTLNHILVADRIWLKRFTTQGEAPKSLDAIIHPNLDPLRIAREAEDKRIIDWIDGLDEETLTGRFTYLTVTDMKTVSQRLAPALAHFFNHQTHHRGQAHTILTMLGRPSIVLDMVYFQRTEDGRRFA